jgi:hypothetical protein
MSTIGNTPRGVSPLSATMLRRRIIWTVVLVLVALGGAGLATAADRQPTDTARPELTWHADRLVEPRIQAMSAQLSAIGEQVDALAEAAREVLGLLPDLEPESINAALADGDEQVGLLSDSVTVLLDARAEQFEQVNDDRLSATNRARLAALDEAIGAVEPLSTTWADLAEDARRVTQLIDALFRHDGLVFRATTAGRQADWERALELLDQARLPLAEAQAVRDALAAEADVETLDDLLGRYAAYDEALVALYDEIERNGQDSADVPELRDEVERTQALLPANNNALRVVVSETAGPAVALGLVEIERARGTVVDARTLLATE